MNTLLGILAAAVLFALFGLLGLRRGCGDCAGGCGACPREPDAAENWKTDGFRRH